MGFPKNDLLLEISLHKTEKPSGEVLFWPRSCNKCIRLKAVPKVPISGVHVAMIYSCYSLRGHHLQTTNNKETNKQNKRRPTNNLTNKQNKTKQNKTKQNKTKQNKTKQNNPKQNKTKQN